MIEIQAHQQGVVLPVRAQPGARNSSLRGEQLGALKVSVTQVAEKGKANKALIGVIGKSLGLRKSQIELLSGRTSAEKRFLIREITIDQLQAKLTQAIANS